MLNSGVSFAAASAATHSLPVQAALGKMSCVHTSVYRDTRERRFHRLHCRAAIVQVMHDLDRHPHTQQSSSFRQCQWQRVASAVGQHISAWHICQVWAVETSAATACGCERRCTPGPSPAPAPPAPVATDTPGTCPWLCLQSVGAPSVAGGGRRR
jgi:hypothetical protein